VRESKTSSSRRPGAAPRRSKVAGGYLTIENKGSLADKLLSASTDVAKKIEIHEMAVNDGVMTMRPVEGGLPIEPTPSP
jgi:copper(I)-binding protein